MANPNYSLFLIIFFVFIFFTFIMPKIDLYNKKYIDNIIPLITNIPINNNNFNNPISMPYYTQPSNIVSTLPSDQILPSDQSLSPINIVPTLPPNQTSPLSNNPNILESHIDNVPIGTISTFISPTEYSNIVNEQTHSLPQANPMPVDNYKIIEHLNNTIPNNMKIDLNPCSQSCCKQTQWLPPFINNNISSEYIGSNFSCNFGNGSGCVCFTKENSKFLENRGNLN